MRLFRHLQPWLGGNGSRPQVADVVPHPHSIRQGADPVPWATMVEAIARSFASRFPPRANSGRRPVSTRVWLALEVLKHAVGAADEAICERLRTDLAVMDACGLEDVQRDSPQAHCVVPETLAQFRGRLDAALIDELLAIQAAAAMAEGLVSPAHLRIETWPSEQGSQRVTDATTLYKAQQKSSNASTPSHDSASPKPPP